MHVCFGDKTGAITLGSSRSPESSSALQLSVKSEFVDEGTDFPTSCLIWGILTGAF